MELQKQSKLYDLETLIKKADIFYGSGGSQNAIFVYKNSVAKLIVNGVIRIRSYGVKNTNCNLHLFLCIFTLIFNK